VIAINNAGLFEEVQARNRDLTALSDVGRAVSSTLDLERVLKTIVDRAVQLSGTDGGSIFYYREKEGRFELGETTGLDKDVGEVSIAASARNGHFAVTVTDTGPGIPLDQQDRIFDQFHQVDNSLTKAKGGTGLGLAIAKQIVEMHGGRIWVESTLGKGSTFQIELPTRVEFRKRTL
jgi:signal transduction histidine kinase